MAKSTRSKTKRTFRRIKRESGAFAAADAARLHRLSAKLRAKIGTDTEGDVTLPEAVEGSETVKGISAEAGDAETDAASSQSKKISTSGRRLSRRDLWRQSKGKSIQTKNPNKLNRLGGLAGKRRAGRPSRRR